MSCKQSIRWLMISLLVLAPFALAQAQAPDLIVNSITGPTKAHPGDELADSIVLVIENAGDAATVATDGYFHTDLVLSQNDIFGDGDDVLLVGGRDQVADVLNPGDTLNVALAGTNQIPATVMPGNYHLIAAVDSQGDHVVESDETNNTDSYPITIEGYGSDLIVNSITGPTKAHPGDELAGNLTLIIENVGSEATVARDGYFHTDLVLSQNMTFGDGDDVLLIGGRDQVTDVLNPGDTLSVTLAGTNQIPSTVVPGAYFIIAKVDSVGDHVAEIDETNNIDYYPILIEESGVDLVVHKLTGPLSAHPGTELGDSLILVIKNIGTDPTAAVDGYFHTDLVISQNMTFGDGDDELLIGGRDQVTDVLNGGDILQVTLAGSNQIPSTVVPGAYFIIAKVDSVSDHVAEIDETNNTGRYPILIEEGLDGSDLVVSSIMGPLTAYPGDELADSLTLIIANVGNAATVATDGYFHTDLVLSKNNIFGDGDDELLIGGRDQVTDVLNPGDTLDVALAGTNQIPATTVPGTYFIIAKVDSQGDHVVETQEDNNTRSYPILIKEYIDGPDLVVDSITGPLSAHPGEVLADSLTLVIANVGSAPTVARDGYFHTDLVLSKNNIFGDGDDELLIGGRDQVTDVLDAGDTLEVALAGSNQIPSTVALGAYLILAKVDSVGDHVVEVHEDDNVKGYPILIEEQIDGPDLVVDNLSGPTTACPGDELGSSILLVIANIGNAPTVATDGYFHTDLVISKNMTFGDGDDELLIGGRDQVFDVLDPGDVLSVILAGTNQIPASIVPGAYFIIAKVDSVGNHVVEAREDDNVRRYPILIEDCGGSQGKVGDVDGSGVVTAHDAALVLQYVVGLIDKFPVEKTSAPSNVLPRDYALSVGEVGARARQHVTIPVMVDATELTSGGIRLKYDPTVLRAVNVSTDLTLNGAYWQANPSLEGEVRFAFVTMKAAEGSGTLFNVEFEVLPDTQGRVSAIELDSVELAGSRQVHMLNGSLTVLPDTSLLLPNYPNPFNPETWLPYQLAEDTAVTLRIFSMSGQLVREFDLGYQSAGTYLTRDRAVYWDGRNAQGERVGSGMYIYQLATPNFQQTRPMVILK